MKYCSPPSLSPPIICRTQPESLQGLYIDRCSSSKSHITICYTFNSIESQFQLDNNDRKVNKIDEKALVLYKSFAMPIKQCIKTKLQM